MQQTGRNEARNTEIGRNGTIGKYKYWNEKPNLNNKI
jgi:hypothetical protein